jgi:hypothetical protein
MDALDWADVKGSLLDLFLGGAVGVATLGFPIVGQAKHAWNIGNAESATDTFILINPWCSCHFISLIQKTVLCELCKSSRIKPHSRQLILFGLYHADIRQSPVLVGVIKSVPDNP